MSTDSKRSFSFGLGKKRSTDLDNQMQTEKPVRRFSLLPNSISFKGLMGGPKDEMSSQPGTPQGDRYVSQGSSRPPTGQEYMGGEPSGTDGQYDGAQPGHYSNYSRAPQSQHQPQKGLPTQQATNDVYGGTGVYAPSSQGRMPHQRQQSEQLGSLSQYPHAVDNSSRPSMQQGRHGRGVLVKPNRKFTEAYDYDQGPGHHSGRSGAVKKVQDFFRRRRAPTDGAYR
jgi:protein-serine/threonine kinase